MSLSNLYSKPDLSVSGLLASFDLSHRSSPPEATRR